MLFKQNYNATMALKEKVSILVPAFNSGKFITKCLDSVLNQTHKNIELLIIDDGSCDDTAEIIESYKKKFAESSMCLVYLYQNNNGQASAINKGLLSLTGDYVAWFDSDDILLPNFAEDLINTIKKNKTQYAIGQLEIVDEDALDKPLFIKKRIPNGDDDFFKDLILESNILYGNGTVLVKKDYLFKKIPSKQIFESKEGQNWQLMLPITYKEKCGYLDKPVSKQVQRLDSHSRFKRTYQEKKDRFLNFVKLLENTLIRIPGITNKELVCYKKIIDQKYTRILFNLAFESGNKQDTEEQYFKLCSMNLNDKMTDRKYIMLCKKKSPLSFYFYKIKNRLKQKNFK